MACPARLRPAGGVRAVARRRPGRRHPGRSGRETLQERIGERLARRIGVEGALVTCGAARGVQQAAAACLTGTDAERVQRLPYTDG